MEFTSKGPTESKLRSREESETHPDKMEIKQFWDVKRRLLLVDNFGTNDVYKRLIMGISEGTITSKHDRLCKGAFSDGYEGEQQCAHNVARAFFEAKQFIDKEISPSTKDW